MVDWMTDLIGTPEKEYPKFMAGLSFLPALTHEDALQALRARAGDPDLQAGQDAWRHPRRG